MTRLILRRVFKAPPPPAEIAAKTPQPAPRVSSTFLHVEIGEHFCPQSTEYAGQLFRRTSGSRAERVDSGMRQEHVFSLNVPVYRAADILAVSDDGSILFQDVAIGAPFRSVMNGPIMTKVDMTRASMLNPGARGGSLFIRYSWDTPCRLVPVWELSGRTYGDD